MPGTGDRHRPEQLIVFAGMRSKYTITAPLRGPQGEVRQVTTVWIIRPNNDFPELVTIVPANRPKESEDESISFLILLLLL
jgi:hypothetical protein